MTVIPRTMLGNSNSGFDGMRTADRQDRSSDQPEQTVYCMGCNERFTAVHGSDLCPRCRAHVLLVRDRSLDETVLIRRRAGAEDEEHHLELTKDTDAHALIGERVDVYQCESLLGVGGMGRVYLALHTELGRRCALKLLSPRQGNCDAEFVARFLHEGRAAAALVHPNIVTTHAIGNSGDYHFIEMEFVVGRSLQQLIDDEGRATPLRAMTLTAKIAEGLAAAHRKDIVHRDLKPDNILLTRRGVPKISDFGLAKRIIGDASGIRSERLCGTPHFMAPELLRGEHASPSSDVYALGVCLYLLLTGRLPHAAESMAELQRQLITAPIPSARELQTDIPLGIAECAALLLEKSRANRPSDANEALQLLQAVLGEVRDVESLLIEAFSDDPSVTWKRSNKQYQLTVQLPEGRTQTLFVEPSDDAVATERLLLIYSICCDACSDYYEQALRLNSVIRHGSLAIREIDGVPKFVAVDTYPRGTADSEEVRRSVLEVAAHADAVERLLTGLDRH